MLGANSNWCWISTVRCYGVRLSGARYLMLGANFNWGWISTVRCQVYNIHIWIPFVFRWVPIWAVRQAAVWPQLPKIAIFGPKTHIIPLYRMILHGIELYLMVLHWCILWYCIGISYGIALVLHGIARCCIVLYSIVLHCTIVGFGVRAVSRKTPIYFM